MIDPEQIARHDQAMAGVSEQIVPFIGTFFKACLKEGFTREEALALTRDFALSAYPGNRKGSEDG